MHGVIKALNTSNDCVASLVLHSSEPDMQLQGQQMLCIADRKLCCLHIGNAMHMLGFCSPGVTSNNTPSAMQSRHYQSSFPASCQSAYATLCAISFILPT